MAKHLLDLHRVDELKNFAADNILSWCFEVAYWDPRNWLVMYLGVVHQKKGTVTTKQVQLDIGVKVQL